MRCQKWGHKAAQCRAPWEKCPAASKKVNEVAEEEYVLMVVPGEEEVKGDIEEKLEEDIVWKEAVSLDETGLARSEDLRAMFAEEVAEVTTGIAERGMPGSCRYFGQDHDATWLPGDLEFTSDEVNRARSSLQEYETCSVMAVEESPLAAGDELAVSVLIDSGAYLHVCPPSFAPTVPVEETAPIVAQSASGKALKYYGQKAVDLITQEGCRLSVVFAVFNVTKPILSAGMMRLRGHSVWLGVNPSLTCGRRRISLKEKGNLFYLTAKVEGAARHAIEMVALPKGPPGLASIPDDFVQKEEEDAAPKEGEKQGGGAAKTPGVTPALTSSVRVTSKQGGGAAKTPRVAPALTRSARVAGKQSGGDAKTPQKEEEEEDMHREESPPRKDCSALQHVAKSCFDPCLEEDPGPWLLVEWACEPTSKLAAWFQSQGHDILRLCLPEWDMTERGNTELVMDRIKECRGGSTASAGMDLHTVHGVVRMAAHQSGRRIG